MAAWSNFRTRLNRSLDLWQKQANAIVHMKGSAPPDRSPLTLLTFNSQEDIDGFSLGSDVDVGGYSTIHLDFVPGDAKDPTEKGKGRYWGDMRLDLRPELRGRMRSGYSGIRNKDRKTLFGRLSWDLSQYEFLVLRARVGGHPRTHHSYYMNVHTETDYGQGILWQHQLNFHHRDGTWEDVILPFSSFRSMRGKRFPHPHEFPGREIAWMGIGQLAGNHGVEGYYELSLDNITAMNIEDVVTLPIVREGTAQYSGTRWTHRATEG